MKKPAPLLTADELHTVRLAQLMEVFALADSTLAGHTVKCVPPPMGMTMGDTPAASARGTVYFNAEAIKDVNTADGIVKVNGLNYHELSHILFTPSQTNLTTRIQGEGLHEAFNVLEDQRIETLLVAMYPSVVPYFVATVAEYFVDVDVTRHGRAWPYLYGRKYLPANMRTYFKDLAHVPGYVPSMVQMESLVDEYRLLDVHNPKNFDRAVEIVRDYANIIGKKQQFSPFGHGGASTCASGGSGVPGTDTQQSEANAEATKQAAKKDAAGENGQGKSDGGEAGTGTSNGGAEIKDPKKDLKKIAQAQQGSSAVQGDIRRQREAMGSTGRKFKGALDKSASDLVAVAPTSKVAAKRFGVQLQKLVTDSDPGYHTHRSTGRINVQRAMQGASLDDVFDEWDGGKQDADSIEMVVLVDKSGSMSGIQRRVNEIAWVLKSGTEAVGRNAQVTVLAFGSSCSTVYGPTDKAHPTKFRNINAGGGTDPTEAIAEARRIFHLSTRAKKLVLFVTDGMWGGGYSGPSHDDHIANMRAHGITTACVYLNTGYGSVDVSDLEAIKKTRDEFGHGCAVFGVVSDVEALVPFGKKLVAQSIRG